MPGPAACHPAAGGAERVRADVHAGLDGVGAGTGEARGSGPEQGGVAVEDLGWVVPNGPVMLERNQQCEPCGRGRGERIAAMIESGPCPHGRLCRVQVEVFPEVWTDALCDDCIREWD